VQWHIYAQDVTHAGANRHCYAIRHAVADDNPNSHAGSDRDARTHARAAVHEFCELLARTGDHGVSERPWISGDPRRCGPVQTHLGVVLEYNLPDVLSVKSHVQLLPVPGWN
jgi:hypothetical protein